jgi:hypothetical protein
MKKKIFWMAVFTFFTMVISGLYLGARQQPKAQPSSTGPTKKAAAAAPSIMAVRMHVHDIKPNDPEYDQADDDDHCIKFDPKPDSSQSTTPTPTPLKVEVDLSDDPGGNLPMNITMFYTNPKHRTTNDKQLNAELLYDTCIYDPNNPKTCTATFGEDSVKLRMPKHAGGPRHPAWHLGDQPDGTYFADGSLSTTTEAGKSSAGPPRLANSRKVPGLPDANFFYAFRNPCKCGAPSLAKKKPK